MLSPAYNYKRTVHYCNNCIVANNNPPLHVQNKINTPGAKTFYGKWVTKESNPTDALANMLTNMSANTTDMLMTSHCMSADM